MSPRVEPQLATRTQYVVLAVVANWTRLRSE